MDYGVEVKLKADFLVIKETLERIGICNKRTKVITPSAYILHKNGKYYIIHFKGLLALDGFREAIDQKDVDRQNAIVTLLKNWNMIDIVGDDSGVYQKELKEKVFVLKHSEKRHYTTNHKYNMRNSNREDS